MTTTAGAPVVADPALHGDAPSSRRSRDTWVLGVLVGTGVGATVLVAGAAGLVTGVVGLLLAIIALVGVPTSALLSRRILVNGVIALGWLPLFAWFSWSPPGGRVAALLAVAVGGVAGWAAAGPRGGRLRRMLPRTARADLLLPLAAGAGAAMASPWLRTPSPTSALSMLMLGWDHAAHYDMTAMIRTHGSVVWAIAMPPSGETWAFEHYPQGSHTVVAGLMELLGGPSPGVPADEVVLYARALGLLFVLLVLLLVAGVAAVPALRRRPLVAAMVAGVVTAALCWGPGGLVVAGGFPNFLTATALLACLPLLVIPSGRWPAPIPLLAVGGALVGIAHSWALLLTMAAPTALALLFPLRRRRAAAGLATWIVSAPIVAAAAASVLVAVAVIRVQSLGAVVVLGGGIVSRPLLELGLAGVALVVAVALLARRHGRRRSDEAVRAVVVAAGPLVGAVLAAWIASVQLRANGLGYYLWKYAIALEVLAVVVGSVAGGIALARSRRLLRSVPRSFGVVGAVVVAVLLAFGAPHPLLGGQVVRESGGSQGRTALATTSDTPSVEAGRLLAAAGAMRQVDPPVIYVPVEPAGSPSPALLGQWGLALSGTWVEKTGAPTEVLLTADLSAANLPDLVRTLLTRYPEVAVVVPPEVAAEVRDVLGEDLAGRVHSW